MLKTITRGLAAGYNLIVLVPAFIVSIFTLFGISILVLAMIVIFSLYRVLTCFSKRRRIMRYAKKLEIRKKRIERKGVFTRTKLSKKADRQNMNDLLSITRKALNRRKDEVMANRLTLTRLLLRDCATESDFERTKQIYDVINQADPGALNDALGDLVARAGEKN